MANEQLTDGSVSVTTASQIVVGYGTDWSEVSVPAIFKVTSPGETTYGISSVVSATRIILNANYSASTNSGLDYTIGRSFTSRGFWRVLSGDSDFADILSQETIDLINDDIDNIITGNATIDGTTNTSFGIDTDGNTLRIKSTNLTASRQYHFPNYNASIASKNASQDWSETQRFDTLTASDLSATTGDIDTLHVLTLTASNLNATTGDIETLHSTNVTASDINASGITIQDWNIMHSRKSTVTTSDLTEASINQSVHLFDTAVGDALYDVMGNVTAGFKYSGNATLIKVEVGDKTDTDGFAKAHLCGSSTSGIIMEGQTGLVDKGTYFLNASAARVPKVYATAASIMARITSSGDTVFMSSLDAGSVDIYVDMISRV